MKKIKAFEHDYIIIQENNTYAPIYPYLRNPNGDRDIYIASPQHGRSFIIGKNKEGRFVISKGNGLSYTQHTFLHTKEFYNGTWGLLLNSDANRDFTMGLQIESLGIKTNKMEYVLEIEKNIYLPNGSILHPTLLQYNVECPFRISDAPFMSRDEIYNYIKLWNKISNNTPNNYHMIAADILLRNLRILHDNKILHNAISEQNYTWSLELLDFELACSPIFPYSKEDNQRHVKDLFPREILQTYIIINYIAGVLKEEINYNRIDSIFHDYGFDLSQFKVKTD